MRPPAAMGKRINLDTSARRIDVDDRLPLRNYYRIADNLIKQASIYREENNILDLYVMLLRYSSLLVDTIPSHSDYQVSLPKERAHYRKKLLAVINELETLEPEFRRLNELNKNQAGPQQYQPGAQKRTLYSSVASPLEWSPDNSRPSSSLIDKQPAMKAPLSSWKSNYYNNQVVSTNSLDMQIQKLSLGVPIPKKETLSRHSLLGHNGLQAQWRGPSPEIKVYYPSNKDLSANSGPIQNVEYDPMAAEKLESQVETSTMEALLSLDDGRWLRPSDESGPSLHNEASPFTLSNIRQPCPPPIRAKVQPEIMPISPSRVADPRPGPANAFQDGTPGSNSYQDLHIPVKMLDDFLRLARENTAKNLETCAVLAGSLKNRVFQITTLIVPKQESTSDSCSTLNEEEIFEVQDRLSLFPLGWIHTHPSQTCFMSSVDLHTHYSYQIMLPEAIAIVMAPTDTLSPHGIFHLSDPSGVSVIRNCQQRGFHPHEEPEDGSPIYEHCSHVFMNTNLRFDVLDLR